MRKFVFCGNIASVGLEELKKRKECENEFHGFGISSSGVDLSP